MPPSVISLHENLIEEITDIATRLPVIQRAVLGMIMLGFTQVEIANLMGVRKNAVSSLKLGARISVRETYYNE